MRSRLFLTVMVSACHVPPATAPIPVPVAAKPAVRPVVAPAPPHFDRNGSAADWQRACEAGEMWSCTTLGVYYWLGDTAKQVPVDWPRALHYLDLACTAKVGEACAAVIVMLESGGHGIAADTARA